MALSAYLSAPFVGYLAAGSLKFIINSFRARAFAFKAIGLGGMPSTHNTVTSTVASLIFFQEGTHSPVLSVAICLAFIVAIDSMSLRKHIESHAKIISRQHAISIRQKIGHSPLEVFAGIVLGTCCGYLLFILGF